MSRDHLLPRTRRAWALRWKVPGTVLWALVSCPLLAQLPSPSDRLDELEKRVAELQKELEEVREEQEDAKDRKKEDEDFFSGGLITLGNEKFRLGGKVELNFIDSESGEFLPLGSAGLTAEPDPHLVLQRLRFTPRIAMSKRISLRGQIDFLPDRGRTRLKELVVRHDVQPEWWFSSRFQVGLDDRFIRPNRRTKSYPLLGNAFWRDETMGLIWRLRFGDRDGRPEDEKKKRTTRPSEDGGPGTEGFQDDVISDDRPGDPFDFSANWGELSLFLSLTQGYVLDTNEVGFDGAVVNDLVQDDRELEEDLSLRELGVGLEYRRNFRQFGELSLMGFLYNDELRDASVEFLQQDLTVRNLGVAVAGYGDSDSTRSYRFGGHVGYFLPASTLYGHLLDTRRRDGLRLFAQAIKGVDGAMHREGWFVQSSFRFSFGRILVDRYFRSFEPLIRYGRLNVNIDPVATLPGTWDRSELVVGGIVEVTGSIFFKLEYTFHDEETGVSSAGNDEFLAQLLIRF